jgi:sugar lactone lactonase YvrE
VREIDADGVITTFAGDGEPGASGDGKPAAQAELGSPDGLALDSEGNL